MYLRSRECVCCVVWVRLKLKCPFLFYCPLYHNSKCWVFYKMPSDCPDLFSTSDKERPQYLFTHRVFQFAKFVLNAFQQWKRTLSCCLNRGFKVDQSWINIVKSELFLTHSYCVEMSSSLRNCSHLFSIYVLYVHVGWASFWCMAWNNNNNNKLN